MPALMNRKVLRIEQDPPGMCDFNCAEMKAAVQRFEQARGIKRRPFIKPLLTKKQSHQP